MTYRDNIWQCTPVVPMSRPGKICVYRVLCEYTFSDSSQRLSIARVRAGNFFQLRADYEGLYVTEKVVARSGHIVEIQSHLRLPARFHDGMTMEESFEELERIFSPPKTKVQDYPNIRGLGEELEMLCSREPTWKQDILALMQKR